MTSEQMQAVLNYCKNEGYDKVYLTVGGKTEPGMHSCDLYVKSNLLCTVPRTGNKGNNNEYTSVQFYDCSSIESIQIFKHKE